MIFKVTQVCKSFTGESLELPDGSICDFRRVATTALLQPVKGDPVDGGRFAISMYKLASVIAHNENVDLSQDQLDDIARRAADCGFFNHMVVGRVNEMIHDAKRREVIHAVALQSQEPVPCDAAAAGDHEQRRAQST